MGLVKGIHHISMKCVGKEEFDKVVYFYKEIIGLKEVRAWDAGIMLDTGSGIVEIFSDGEAALQKGVIRHFAFAVDNADECVSVVRKAGYEIFVEPKDVVLDTMPARVAFCRGPLGEEIEFFQERDML